MSKIKKNISICKSAIILLLFIVGGLILIYPIISKENFSEYWWYLLLMIATCICVSTTGTKGSYFKRYIFFAAVSIVLVSVEVYIYKTGFIDNTIEKLMVSIVTSIMFAVCLVVPTVLGAAINNMILKMRNK